jgi:RND family efflux transporter MFP subunit
MEDKSALKPKRPVLTVVVRVLACIAVLAVGVFGMKKLAALKQPPAEALVEERPLQVAAQKVVLEEVVVVIRGYGEARSLKSVVIAPEVSGTVEDVHPKLDVGERIAKGQLLFRIDERNYRAAAAEARAAVSQWQSTILRLQSQHAIDRQRLETFKRNTQLALQEFQRLQRLLDESKVGTRAGVERAEQAYNQAVDQQDQLTTSITLHPVRLEEARSSLAAARARRALAETNLERCRVNAPFDGRLKMVDIEAGQFVSPGQSALTLVDDRLLEIQVPLNSQEASRWLQFDSPKAEVTGWFGQVAEVPCTVRWTEDKADHTWFGKLHRVVAFDPQTRTLTVAVRVNPNDTRTGADFPLVEGMFCEVEIPGKTLPNAARLPHQAVSFENTVYLAVDNRLKTVPVVVARSDDQYTYVKAGLADGDIVITTRLVDPLENALLEISLKEYAEG